MVMRVWWQQQQGVAVQGQGAPEALQLRPCARQNSTPCRSCLGAVPAAAYPDACPAQHCISQPASMHHPNQQSRHASPASSPGLLLPCTWWQTACRCRPCRPWAPRSVRTACTLCAAPTSWPSTRARTCAGPRRRAAQPAAGGRQHSVSTGCGLHAGRRCMSTCKHLSHACDRRSDEQAQSQPRWSLRPAREHWM